MGDWEYDFAQGKGRLIHGDEDFYDGDFIKDKAEGHGCY